jgi:hypothetical protein
MSESPRIEAFSKIYEERIWGEEPRSGDGSRPEAALPYVLFLSKVIEKYNIKSVLDIGHGDWAMWPEGFFENVTYLGVDAAQGLSEEMQAKHGRKNISFQHQDAVNQLPSGYELVLCKDVIQHLPVSDSLGLLSDLSNTPYILLCSDIKNRSLIGRFRRILSAIAPKARLRAIMHRKSPFENYGISHNSEIEPGGWQSIDLRENPFNLKKMGLNLIDTFEFDGSPHYGELIRKRVYLLTTTGSSV